MAAKSEQSPAKPNLIKPKSKAKSQKKAKAAQIAKFPRHALTKVLRVPQAILDQNAGKACSEAEAAKFVGVGLNGPFRVELSSGKKYGILESAGAGRIKITERARKILRPQASGDKLEALRDAVGEAPDIGDVYRHYRGENLPDLEFLRHAFVDKFKIPEDKVVEFEQIFLETMVEAQLIEEHGSKKRLLDVAQAGKEIATAKELKKLGTEADVKDTDTCFVMMPFADPIGKYYDLIYKPAILKAGLKPIRADADIFGTGKIIDQIWRGINDSRILVAELTDKNANVFYELGLAHALNKPVVLVSSNEADVPFDLQHIRVIYYDQADPFWGEKLIDKIAENVLSAMTNPEEAVFSKALKKETS